MKMTREINGNYVYLVLSPMEYSHIRTLLNYDIDEVSDNDAAMADLIYIREALINAVINFKQMNDLEGGDEDEDEQ